MTDPSSKSTTTSGLAPLQPPNLYYLSPTYNKWCALRCADIVALKNSHVYLGGESVHHHLNHPIRFVKLIGLVVSIDDFARRRVYTIDDSSGECIECVALLPAPPKPTQPSTSASASTSTSTPISQPPHSNEPTEPSTTHPQIPYSTISECSIVRILGVMSTYMGMPQVQVVKMGVVESTDVERKWWDECERLKREVLGVEWRVSREEVKRWEMRERRRRREKREEEGERKVDVKEKDEREKRKRQRERGMEREKAKRERHEEEMARVRSHKSKHARPRSQSPTNEKDKDIHHLATHPSASVSIPLSKPPTQPRPSSASVSTSHFQSKEPTHLHPPSRFKSKPHKPEVQTETTDRSKHNHDPKSKPKTNAPLKRRIIPVSLTDLSNYDTFGL